jgi:cathepsin B
MTLPTTAIAVSALLVHVGLSVLTTQPDSKFPSKGTNQFGKFSEVAQQVSKMKTTWKAKASPNFDYDSNRIQALTSLIISEKDYLGMPTISWFDVVRSNSGSYPMNFTASEKWPECAKSITEVVDQGYCGSCWAIGATSALTDRLCIMSKGLDRRRLSEQDMLECCSTCGLGCGGGSVVAAYDYARTNGVSTGGSYMSTGSCKPYAFAPCSDALWRSQPVCSTRNTALTCRNSCQFSYKSAYLPDKIKAKSSYRVLGGETVMIGELVEKGPLTVAIMVYQDFMTYTSGVYQHQTGVFLGGHAITLVGYGVENGVKFWLCKNSWGRAWGDKGFVKIRRGTNEVMIESYVVAGVFV